MLRRNDVQYAGNRHESGYCLYGSTNVSCKKCQVALDKGPGRHQTYYGLAIADT